MCLKTLSGSRKYVVLCLSVLLLFTAVAAYSLAGQLHARKISELSYSENTLFLNNNTLLSGNYPNAPSFPGLTPPAFLYLSPINNELYITGGKGYPILILNTSTNLLTGSLPTFLGSGSVAFDTRNNITYIPTGSNVTTVSSDNKIIANISMPFSTFMVSYDPFNNEFYATTPMNSTSSYNRVYALNSSLDIIKQVYVSFEPANFAYNSFNHFIYVVNSHSGTVTVISPNDTIVRNVTVGFGPDRIAVDPADGTVYVANMGENNISIITSNFNVSSVAFNSIGSPTSVAYDAAAGVAVVGYYGGEMKVLKGNNVVGTVRFGGMPNSAVYDAHSQSIYVGFPASDTVSIVQLNLSYITKIELPLTAILIFVTLVAADATAYCLLRRFP